MLQQFSKLYSTLHPSKGDDSFVFDKDLVIIREKAEEIARIRSELKEKGKQFTAILLAVDLLCVWPLLLL